MRRSLRHTCVVLTVVTVVAAAAPPSDPAVASLRPSEYVNAYVPQWLKLTAEERVRFDAQNAFAYKQLDDGYVLHRARLGAEITARHWLRFTLLFQDSRAFLAETRPTPSNLQNPGELLRFYAQVGDPELDRIVLRVGRQSVAFGEGRIISEPNWGNVGRSLDAVRLTLRRSRVSVELIGAAVAKADPLGFDKPTPGDRFYGAYGGISKLIPSAQIEPYVFRRTTKYVRTELAGVGSLDQWTAGVRWGGTLRKQVDYSLETVMQRGQVGNEPISAWALHGHTGYTFADSRHKPRVYAEANLASGDSNPADGKRGRFETIAAGGHDRFGVLDRATWANLMHGRTGLQYLVRPSLRITAAYSTLWLAQERDGIYTGGRLAVSAKTPHGRHIGEEFDFLAQWTVSRNTLVNLKCGRLFSGRFLRNAGFSAINGLSLALTRTL